MWKDRRSGAKLKDFIESIESVEGPVAFPSNDAAGGMCPRRFGGLSRPPPCSRCAGVISTWKGLQSSQLK